ncbi:MAG: hypothetical protein JXB29_13250 [Sedimentisphaerales bacterium]|nr:hypothetical protein [Sedimentisphaerales bacterium]
MITLSNLKISSTITIILLLNLIPAYPATAQMGACCDEFTGDCYESEVQDCYMMWLGPGTTCEECQPMGACCDESTGDCYESKEQECSMTWLGPGTTCQECEPIGACCEEMTGDCYLSKESECGYMWLGAGTTCDECIPQPLGACCLYNGGCYECREWDCYDGTWLGPWTNCDQCQSLYGACCHPYGNCELTLQEGCYGDTWLGQGTVCEQCEQKSELQQPDQDSYTRTAVSAATPFVLAEDFKCTEVGSVASIIIWGSWYEEYLPNDDPTAVTFDLSLHENLTPGQNPTDHNIPGQVLWSQTFSQMQFDCEEITNTESGFYDPNSGTYQIWKQWRMWRYKFALDGSFIQLGTEYEPLTYWLSVSAEPKDGNAVFGWINTTPWQSFNDNAVWINSSEPVTTWAALFYPQ